MFDCGTNLVNVHSKQIALQIDNNFLKKAARMLNEIKVTLLHNAICPLVQKPLATSALASSVRIVDLLENISPFRGCNSGSIFTSLQISSSISAVKSRSSYVDLL